ncbi:hypothetical protein L873DRAFT_1790700 [Choiromyces venosus 120613-1]|uniref:Uncharacterized protein n=1 Tax=Choiromyces venosus 120613-1 TaxID=1336337 RepID=A0A3N4JMW8_9PEZI|nr:hypothetical protein L873DRAFT_1790700 [Choiromyces venosus 120613-1]
MSYQLLPQHFDLTFSPGEFPCPNDLCATKFYIEVPLLVQNTRTRTTLPATVSKPTRDLLVGQCYACQQRICLLCLNAHHVYSECGVVPCAGALEKFRAAWDMFEQACPVAIRARHEGTLEEEVEGDLDAWDAITLVHEVRTRESIFKELQEAKEWRGPTSIRDRGKSFYEEETAEGKENRVWEGYRRELRKAYEVLVGEYKC